MTEIVAATPPDDSLPDDFDPFEHLQTVYIPQHNAVVKRFFSDLPDDWKPNIATARSSLRTACTMLDNDNQLMMNLRHHLVFDLLGYGKSDLIIYHGAKDGLTSSVVGHPKVTLYFSQDEQSITPGEPRIDAEISFRLMTETQATFTPGNALTIAEKVKLHFVTGNEGVVFTKGKNIYLYKDETHGYRLQIYGNSKSDIVDIIQRCLEIQDLTYDENKLTISTPEKNSDTTTSVQLSYGKERRKKRFRPIQNVRFRYCFVEVPGYDNHVFLVDTTYRHKALVKIT
ncbi:MAG: hypothetical protein V7K57_21915 [Nostoc sp.]|uniref:hypothetical protein n=1 Tax=Nostoc sp. TaxID=1180 RepID=UPI002FF4D7A5